MDMGDIVVLSEGMIEIQRAFVLNSASAFNTTLK